METTRKTPAAVILATAAMLLVGCTGGSADAGGEGSGSPSPSASATPSLSATPTSNPSASAEEAQLPMPPDEIADWAKDAVPGAEDDAYASGFSGWMSASTSAHHRTDLRSIEPGSYQGQLACRGDGTITLTAGGLTDEPEVDGASAPISCANSTIAFDVVTTDTGMRIDLDHDGAPTIYAVSLLRMG